MKRGGMMVGAVLVAAAAVSTTSVAVAVDSRGSEPAPTSAAAVVQLRHEVAALRARVSRDEGAVDGDNPGPPPAQWSDLQRDVHDLGSVIQSDTSAGSSEQLRVVVNDLLAICRGQRTLYVQAGLRAPACPGDVS